MTTLKVEGMHCEKCVARISDAFKAAEIEFEISLAQKTVSVEDSKVELAKEELDDLGFEL